MMRGFALAGVAFFAVVLLYLPTLPYPFIAWDEIGLIHKNPIVKEISLKTMRQAFSTYDPELYIPLTLLSYQVDYRIGGLNALPYRVQNVLWHAVNAALVTWITMLLFSLFSPLYRSWQRGAALAAGLLFALHPLHTEAVVWIPGRKDLLSAFWFLLSLVLYLQHRQRKETGERLLRSAYVGSVLCFLLALLSKVSSVSLPAILLLIEGAHAQNVRRWRPILVRLGPFAFLSFVFGIVALVGKSGTAGGGVTARILMAGKSTAFYVSKLLWPTDLSPMYPFTESIALTSPTFAASLLFVFGLCTLFAVLWQWQRTAAVGLGFFLIALLPTFFTIVRNEEVYFASDRYAYLASAGFLIGVVALVSAMLANVNARWTRSIFPTLLLSGVLLGFVLRASAQTRVWRDSETLFRHTIALYPAALSARVNLGLVYLHSRMPREAREQFETAQTIRATPEALRGLGSIAVEEGRARDAIAMYEEAITLQPENAESYAGLGEAYAQLRDDVRAIAAYERAIGIIPHYASALNNLGNLHLRKGRLEEGIVLLARAVEADPGTADYLFNLAVALAKNKRIAEARAMLRRVLSLDSSDRAARELLVKLQDL